MAHYPSTSLRTSRSTLPFHIMALVIALIWSTTFVSTKVLLSEGMTPETIFLSRFVIAYVLIIFLVPKPLFAKSVKDEVFLALAGLSGGSLYFLTENTALKLTYATNVSILILATPLLTILLSACVFRQKLHKSMLLGSLLALAGVVLVVFNGNVTFKLSPKGDLLTLAASLCWAVYSVILKFLSPRHYSTLFITRKVFFYGLATMAVYFIASGDTYDFSLLKNGLVYGNLIFLGVVASLICFVAWNKVLEVIGPDKANNYMYLSPLGTMTTAVIVIHEPLSWMAVIGAAVTLAGVIVVEKVK